MDEAEKYSASISESLKKVNHRALQVAKDLHSMKGMAKALHLEDHVQSLTKLEDQIVLKNWDGFQKDFPLFHMELEKWIKTKRKDFTNEPEPSITLSDLVKDLKIRHASLPVLVLSMHSEALYAERSIRAGARG